MYLFDTKTINLTIILLLNKYLFTVSKCLLGTIKKNMYQDLIFFSVHIHLNKQHSSNNDYVNCK